MSHPRDAVMGTVYLVGAGPGDPELLTVRATRLLASADVVYHDDLVPAAILNLVSQRACLVSVGKRCGAKRVTQEQINDLLVEAARDGLAVVRLKSGDPMLFGRAAEEIDALRAHSIPFEVVPGISAAFAAAAALECSLTDRRQASQLLITSAHHAASGRPQGDDTTRIVYMPGSDFAGIARQWMREGLSLSLPCVLVSNAARPDQQVQVTTLAELPHALPGPAPLLLLAGRVFADVVSGRSTDQLLLQQVIAASLPGAEGARD